MSYEGIAALHGRRFETCGVRQVSGVGLLISIHEILPRTASILGCGYLGLPLAAELAKRGWHVRGATTTPAKLTRIADAGAEPFLLRIPEDALGQPRFFGSEVLVLNIPPGRKRPEVERWFKNAVDVITEASLLGGVAFLLFASSTSVYAPQSDPLMEEDAGKAIPPTASGRALLRAEQALRSAGCFDTTILRFAGLYGYDRAPGRFVRGVIQRGNLPVNLVHRDDAVAAMVTVLEQNVRGETFNVCAHEHPSRGAFYRRAAEWLGQSPPRAMSGDTSTYKCVSSRRLSQKLGFTFRHPDPLVPAP